MSQVFCLYGVEDFQVVRGGEDTDRINIRGVELLAFMWTICSLVSGLATIHTEIISAASFLLCFIDRTSLLGPI